MLATVNGQMVRCADTGIWDLRMVLRSLPMRIKSFYPDVGRGSIEHRTVSHEKADRRLKACGKKSIVEKLLGWLDV